MHQNIVLNTILSSFSYCVVLLKMKLLSEGKILLRGICTAVFLLFLISPSFAADDSLQKGNAAYEKGYYTEAAEFYKRAAEQGNPEAQNRLGLLYHNGEGVTQDHAEAERWFRRAAAQGNEEAKLNLRYSYNKVHDVKPENPVDNRRISGKRKAPAKKQHAKRIRKHKRS